jgi:hypothetical protein
MSQIQPCQATPKDAAASLSRRRLGCLAACLFSPLVFVLVILLLVPTHSEGVLTQISLVNTSGAPVRVDSIWFDDKSIFHNELVSAYHESQDKLNPRAHTLRGYVEITPAVFSVEIRYVDLNSREEYHGQFEADRSPHSKCWFAIILRTDGPELSECRRSELLDFD